VAYLPQDAIEGKLYLKFMNELGKRNVTILDVRAIIREDRWLIIATPTVFKRISRRRE